MWANSQRYGHPAKYIWRPLFNAAKFGWRPLLEYCAVTLPRCETRWNLLGFPKLANRSQPLVGRSSLYCEDMWGICCCLTNFFPIVDMCLSCEDIVRQSCAMVPRWQIFWRFFGSCISSELRAAQTCILNSHWGHTVCRRTDNRKDLQTWWMDWPRDPPCMTTDQGQKVKCQGHEVM